MCILSNWKNRRLKIKKEAEYAKKEKSEKILSGIHISDSSLFPEDQLQSVLQNDL